MTLNLSKEMEHLKGSEVESLDSTTVLESICCLLLMSGPSTIVK